MNASTHLLGHPRTTPSAATTSFERWVGAQPSCCCAHRHASKPFPTSAASQACDWWGWWGRREINACAAADATHVFSVSVSVCVLLVAGSLGRFHDAKAVSAPLGSPLVLPL
eukprot:TRINITY_DN2816_c0_g2_i1.p6 TRINITY_DN2816_c0_g2~~TRINITY_DN2816_c0_g2_i1.p6  ORF type:complete len:112 (+),score=2.37 TRINITY_DN2816_c0_g2_i1:2051-2386(+)